jgi:hypothetical protein
MRTPVEPRSSPSPWRRPPCSPRLPASAEHAENDQYVSLTTDATVTLTRRGDLLVTGTYWCTPQPYDGIRIDVFVSQPVDDTVLAPLRYGEGSVTGTCDGTTKPYRVLVTSEDGRRFSARRSAHHEVDPTLCVAQQCTGGVFESWGGEVDVVRWRGGRL